MFKRLVLRWVLQPKPNIRIGNNTQTRSFQDPYNSRNDTRVHTYRVQFKTQDSGAEPSIRLNHTRVLSGKSVDNFPLYVTRFSWHADEQKGIKHWSPTGGPRTIGGP